MQPYKLNITAQMSFPPLLTPIRTHTHIWTHTCDTTKETVLDAGFLFSPFLAGKTPPRTYSSFGGTLIINK